MWDNMLFLVGFVRSAAFKLCLCGIAYLYLRKCLKSLLWGLLNYPVFPEGWIYGVNG